VVFNGFISLRLTLSAPRQRSDPHIDEEIRARLVQKGEVYILLWERALEA